MSLSFVAPDNVLNPLWRTHSYVLRRHLCRRPVAFLRGLSEMYTNLANNVSPLKCLLHQKLSDIGHECPRGTHEPVRALQGNLN